MVEDWLIHNAPGYDELSEEEKRAIRDFSLLWSLFEAQVLNNSASANSIRAKVIDWDSRGLLKKDDFEKFKEYFTQRYVDNKNLNFRFQHLHLRNNDNPALVEKVLKDETDMISEIATGLLIIVLRYRNNSFHGFKWAYGFKEQFDNFRIASELLICALEING